MKKADLLAAIKGKPVSFTTKAGLKVDLRPITAPERMEILQWLRDSKDEFLGWSLKYKYAALGLCDGDGDRLFNTDEMPIQPLTAADLDDIADEVARRAGMLPEKDQGKE
jgi:hypothetical protein